ncbi:MAG: hypothetical protein HN341_18190 [Verrucomicrobia bacterium]|nr:hypothetical protein [Verrucomicrobiota bacterium]
MTESRDNPRCTLSHLKRLTREGSALLHDRPLDELAHAKWLDRAEKYLERKMPDVQVLPPDQLISIKMPNLLSPNYSKPHPLDAAMSRSEQGQRLIQKFQAIIASAIERLELTLESETP